MEEEHVVGVDTGLEFVRRKLMDGWVAVIGEEECIKKMKKQVAPPYTSENGNMIFISIGNKNKVLRVYLAKKTEKLRKFLYGDIESINLDMFSRTLMVEALKRGEECVYDVVLMEDIPSDTEDRATIKEKAIEKLLEVLRKEIENG